jgi:hypothetical protein
MIVILAAGNRGRKFGHFSGCAWRADEASGGHEVAINPALFERPEDLLGTLIPEVVHGLLFEWGLNGGCGPGGVLSPRRVPERQPQTRIGLRIQQ